MKYLVSVLFFMVLLGCNPKPTSTIVEEQTILPGEIKSDAINHILDSCNVKGVILIYDAQNETFYSNDFERANKGYLPASTFKIPNSIIALETGIVENDSTLFKWDGEPRRLKIWEQDLIFRNAFHLSCVPCYQEIARKVGPEKMNEFLAKFEYGDMKVDSSNIDVFWLEGESTISAMQQIEFLKKFYFSDLPVSKRTTDIMKQMIVIEKNPNYKLSGKTGWAIRNDNDLGWFVGYVEVGDKVYFFATNMEPNEGIDMEQFPTTRNKATMEAIKQLGFINGSYN